MRTCRLTQCGCKGGRFGLGSLATSPPHVLSQPYTIGSTQVHQLRWYQRHAVIGLPVLRLITRASVVQPGALLSVGKVPYRCVSRSHWLRCVLFDGLHVGYPLGRACVASCDTQHNRNSQSSRVTRVRELCVIGIHCVAAPCTIKRTSHHCWLGFPCVKAPEGLIVVVVG